MARLRPVGDWIAGRYEIFAVHPGGMGVVYVARDLLGPPGRSVLAIKTLRDEWLLDRDWKGRFAVEGQLWAGLGSHPNIVHAYSVEEFDGKPHILLELVTGGDLRKRIGSPDLDPSTALHLGIQFCLGMEHAIRQGLRCHRDVKPGNLMIAEDGTLKITDFGLAVIRDDLYSEVPCSLDGTIPLADVTPTGLIDFDDPADRPSKVVYLDSEAAIETTARPLITARRSVEWITQTGSLLGTIAYMVLEQFRRDLEGQRRPRRYLRLRGRPLRDADRQAPLPRPDPRPTRPRPLDLRPALRRPLDPQEAPQGSRGHRRDRSDMSEERHGRAVSDDGRPPPELDPGGEAARPAVRFA